MLLIAFNADCLLAKVTKAQPLDWPLASRNTVHSSIVPWLLNIARTSFSHSFLLSMPTNSFLSETARKESM